MSKTITELRIHREDICRAVEKLDYELAGKLRTVFSMKAVEHLEIHPEWPIKTIVRNDTTLLETIEAD